MEETTTPAPAPEPEPDAEPEEETPAEEVAPAPPGPPGNIVSYIHSQISRLERKKAALVDKIGVAAARRSHLVGELQEKQLDVDRHDKMIGDLYQRLTVVEQERNEQLAQLGDLQKG